MGTINIGDSESYEFDFANPDNQEVMLLERLFDGTFGEWANAMSKSSIKALTALVCTLRRRENPALKLGDVHFNIRDLRMIQDEVPANESDSKEESDEENPTE